MTPEHLTDLACHLIADMQADLLLMKEHGHSLNEKEIDWCLADLHRQFHFTIESLKEFANACERIGIARNRSSKPE